MGWNMSNILVNEAIANKKSGGGGSDIGQRVTALESEVDTLETTVSTLNPNVYSTTETEIGEWLGNKLYRKVIACGALPNDNSKEVSTGLSNVTIRKLYGVVRNSVNNNIIPLQRVSFEASSSVVMFFKDATGEIVLQTQGDLSNLVDAEVVLEYFKNPATEQNTRKRGK